LIFVLFFGHHLCLRKAIEALFELGDGGVGIGDAGGYFGGDLFLGFLHGFELGVDADGEELWKGIQ